MSRLRYHHCRYCKRVLTIKDYRLDRVVFLLSLPPAQSGVHKRCHERHGDGEYGHSMAELRAGAEGRLP